LLNILDDPDTIPIYEFLTYIRDTIASRWWGWRVAGCAKEEGRRFGVIVGRGLAVFLGRRWARGLAVFLGRRRARGLAVFLGRRRTWGLAVFLGRRRTWGLAVFLGRRRTWGLAVFLGRRRRTWGLAVFARRRRARGLAVFLGRRRAFRGTYGASYNTSLVIHRCIMILTSPATPGWHTLWDGRTFCFGALWAPDGTPVLVFLGEGSVAYQYVCCARWWIGARVIHLGGCDGHAIRRISTRLERDILL